ncbi:MAG: long-chain acyl-CoA synthetase, partial [Kiritimatiellia bacterium]
DAYDRSADSIDPGRMATLIYTSGTTGRPKGVVLTHDCWVYESEAIDRMGIISAADKQFLFLPLSHVFAKAMMILFVRLGVPTAIDGDQDNLPKNLAATRPTWMAAVPRVFEKAQNQIMNEVKSASGFKKGAFQWSLRVGEQVSRVRQQHREPNRLLRMRYRVAERLVFDKVRTMFGGRMRFMLSGGAPLSPDIARFFHACGILILEGYGLTESSAASCVNTPDSFVFGTVGCPLPGTQVKLSDQGEILLKSRGNMLGYYNLPELSAQAFTDDGWLRTGDIGTVLDTGHLKITGRIKHLIITAGGKNIAPSNFQNQLKASSNYVSQVLVHGDKRNFCVALVTINEKHVRNWAREQGIQASTYSQLADNESVKALVWEAVDAVNKRLPSYETVKRIHLCSEEWTVANGALTPSLKVKRRVVEENCAEVLDAFYAGAVHKM